MAATFLFKILSPDGKKREITADLITINTTNGMLGIMKNHAPLEAIINIGELQIKNGNKYEFIALNGGILHIDKKQVLILANSFESKEEIDLVRATNAKNRAEEKLKIKDENIDIKRAEIALKKALNRINIFNK